MRTATTTEGTGRRVGLDRTDVVARALDLVETDGADALTMRRLAAELDVTTTSVYWHVGSRDELVTEVIRLQAERQGARRITGTSPRRRVMSAARHVWQSALDHREVTLLAYQHGATSLLELPLEIALVRELEAAGVTGADAATALRSILNTIGGFLVIALRDDAAVPTELRREALWSGVEDPGIGPETVLALTEPADVAELFESTLQAVVDAHLRK